MRRIARALSWLLLTTIVVVALAAFAYRQLVLPQIDGTSTVVGLSGPVDVVRDAAGIPHLYAQRDDDAWFALGYVHAQDRLWQMEMNRRTAAGRLAEVLGAPAVETDRFLRTLGVRRNAEAIASRLDASTRRALDRYAAGVNANLEQRRARPRFLLPPEFALTGAPFPEPWTPADSIGWSTMMAWDLSGNWNGEIARMRLAERLTKRQIDELMPPYPGNPKVDAEGACDRRGARPGARRRGLSGVVPAPRRRGAGTDANGRLADRARAVRPLRRHRLEQLGRVRRPHHVRQAAARERSAPHADDAVGLVHGAPVGTGARRDRRDAARPAVRRDRPQRAHRLGPHEHRTRHAGPVHRAAADRRRRRRGAHARRLATARDDRARRSASRAARTWCSWCVARVTGRWSRTCRSPRPTRCDRWARRHSRSRSGGPRCVPTIAPCRPGSRSTAPPTGPASSRR